MPGTVGSTAALFTIFVLKEVLDFPTRESCYEQSQLVQSQVPRKRWGWDLSPSQCVDNSDVPNGRTCRFVSGQLVLLIIASHHWEPHLPGLEYNITYWANWFWTLFRGNWKISPLNSHCKVLSMHKMSPSEEDFLVFRQAGLRESLLGLPWVRLGALEA